MQTAMSFFSYANAFKSIQMRTNKRTNGNEEKIIRNVNSSLLYTMSKTN